MERILIIQTAFIGDAVLTLPMITVLKRRSPASVIDIIAIPSTREIFSASPFVNEVIVLDKRKTHKSLSALNKFIKDIRSRNYDKLYSPHRSFRTAMIVLGSDIRDTYGFSNSSLKHVFKYLVEYNPEKHEVQRNLDLIGHSYDEHSWKILPQISIPVEEEEKALKYLGENNINKGFIAISPGTVWNTKQYPEIYLIQIIEWLRNLNKQVVIIGGESDKPLAESIRSKFSEGVFNAAGQFTLVGSVQLLKYSGILLTNDSAPTHLGMCADIKVLTLYCSTIPGFGFYPYNNLSRNLSMDDLYCKPCGVHGYDKCPLNHFECGKRLLPELVINTIKEMIS